MTGKPSRINAILLAVLVTFLWSTSWVLIKIGLQSDLPPITFAGLRYTLAFLGLSPLVLFSPRYRHEAGGLGKTGWSKLAVLGLFTITISQGAQFVALAHLPAAMVSLILNLTSVFVAISGIYVLKELPSSLQWLGVGLAVLGTCVYFLPIGLQGAQWVGMLAALICLGSNVPTSLLGRQINRAEILSPLIITWGSMGIGSLLMLLIGILVQGLGHISGRDWLIIAWLAVINTAFAFTIWNHTLRVLTAMESSVLNNLMMPQIAILAWLFLRETLTSKEILGMLLVGIGVLIVQLRRPHAAAPAELVPERTI